MAVEEKLYLGNIFHSIERLPQWYQIVAVLAVFLLYFLCDTEVVGWLASSLHTSFGTEMVWSDEYQRVVELMSFNERICLTLYGATLSFIGLIAYKTLYSDVLEVGLQECGIVGERKRWPLVFLFAALLCDGIILVKEVVSITVSNPQSLASLAIKDFINIEETPFDPRLKNSNVHFIVQLEILKNLIFFFLERSIPAAVIACVYRLVWDVPRKVRAALRWYLVTLMFARTLTLFYAVYRQHVWHTYRMWVQCFFTLSLFFVVNYMFGPSQRGGWTAAPSVVSVIKQTISATLKCTGLLFVVSIVTLAFVVSVHVVELVLLWLIMFMATVWVPAIIDSCAIEYVVSLVTAVCYVWNKMGYSTEWGASRMWALLSIWWIDICLLYNLATNVFRSRYGGIAVLVSFAVWFVRAAVQYSGTYNILFVAEANAAVLAALVVGEKLPANGSLFAYLLRSMTFISLLQLSAAVGFFIVMGIFLVSVVEPPVVRERLRQLNIILVTPGVLFRKFVKTLVLATCWIIFVITALLLNYILLPMLSKMVPEFVFLFITLGLSCTILGSLMDMKDTLYITALRFLGVLDPPSPNENDEQ